MTTTIRLIAAAMALIFGATSTQAMTLTEFKKFTVDEQGLYIGAAVNMTVFVYLTTNQSEKARCIQSWYFGKLGEETPGPKAIRLELAGAAGVDPNKYHVEAIILGVTDRACDAKPATRVK